MSSTSPLLNYTKTTKEAKNKTFQSILDCPFQKGTEAWLYPCSPQPVGSPLPFKYCQVLTHQVPVQLQIHNISVECMILNVKVCPTCCGTLRYCHVSFLF